MLEVMFIMLVITQMKHLIADYYLQLPYMYENKGKENNWIRPLIDHSIVHSTGTAILIGIYSFFVERVGFEIIIGLILFDFITHFITDRWKATRKTDPSQSWFWESLGIDQMIHHVVGIIIVYILITQGGLYA